MNNRIYITHKDISEALTRIGIGSGDIVMLHADTMVLAQMKEVELEEKMAILTNAFQNAIGVDGTLIVPTFSYSFCMNKSFDVLKTPSAKELGVYSEFIRKYPQGHRTLDPIFSVKMIGKEEDKALSLSCLDCFGESSIFDFLYQNNGKIVCLGCPLDRATFVHYLEQKSKVDYRYFKYFSGNIIDMNGDITPKSVRYLVRNLDMDFVIDLKQFKESLLANGKMLNSQIGRVGISSVDCKTFFSEGLLYLNKFPNGLIRKYNK
ncbi:MAG: AAC(3) family N-acetyltransferase [Pseudomonadota bacterium]